MKVHDQFLHKYLKIKNNETILSVIINFHDFNKKLQYITTIKQYQNSSMCMLTQNEILQFCPVWVAPNLLTFSGFLLTVLNFLLFSYYDYGFYALTKENITNDHIPSWVWAVSAVNLFVAYTLGEHYKFSYLDSVFLFIH